MLIHILIMSALGCDSSPQQAPDPPVQTVPTSPSMKDPAPPDSLSNKQRLEPLQQSQHAPLFEHIKKVLQTELPIQDFDTEWAITTNGRIYEVNVGEVPSGYTKQYVVAIRSDLVLLAGNEDSSQIKMLDHLEGTYVNITKFDLFQGQGNQGSQGNHLYVWSQLPASAAEMTSEVTWDGTHLKLVSQTEQDLTMELLQKQQALIKNWNFEEAMKLDEPVLYPNAYEKYYANARLAIVESYKYALDKYKKQDLTHAIPALKWGINQYLYVQTNGTVSLDNFENVNDLFEPNANNPGENNKITKAEFIRILNDYAFLLSESGDDRMAEGYLLKVIELEPQRAVAYLNLADVSWNVGKKEQAKSYYKQYLTLIGSDTKDVPQRVYDRSK